MNSELTSLQRQMGKQHTQCHPGQSGAVTGMVLKDVPGDIPKLDSCPSCTLTKAQRLPFKDGRTRATKPLELIHGDLVGPMPVESVGHCKCRFVLMDDYSHASWVLLLRAKSNAPTAFEAWAALMENGTDSEGRTAMACSMAFKWPPIVP